MVPRPDATTVKVALWPAVTVWFAGCALIERRLAAKQSASAPKFMMKTRATINANAKRRAMATLLRVLVIENNEQTNEQQHTYEGLMFFKGRS